MPLNAFPKRYQPAPISVSEYRLRHRPRNSRRRYESAVSRRPNCVAIRAGGIGELLKRLGARHVTVGNTELAAT